MHINSTQLAGLIAFVPPAVAGVLACTRAAAPHPGRRASWAVIALVFAILAVEVVTRTRYVLADGVREWLKSLGDYPERRPAQGAALLVVVAVTLAVIAFLIRCAPSRATAVARGAACASVALFVGESVSLHSVDGILYHPAGPILLIGWLWLACGVTAAIAAAIAMR